MLTVNSSEVYKFKYKKMENSQSFNINFQQRFDKSNSNAHRKHVANILKGASTQLNNQDVCSLVANELHSYTNNNYQEKLNDKLNSVLSQSNRIIGANFTSNLDKIDPKQYIKPLTCTVNKSYCPQSEQFPEHEFIQLMEVFKNKNTNHSSMPNQFNQCKQVIYPENKSEKINKNKKIEQSSFKTAREELEVQIGLKYGNGNAQKKKLGNRGRGVNSKFIPPILANSGSNEEVKLESKLEDPSKLDKRLQNIEAKMIELIKSEIMDCNTDLHWDDIAGLNFAKTAIQEAVVWPLLRPDIFTGLRRPPKGILLFGPPGTGKTLIGKCVASQSKSTFFSISASSLTSKWVGDGEKMVRALFAVARVEQPSVIFIDEVDSLLSQRSDTEHESSRRIKTEFLVQLDGAATDSDERLLVIGATNRPQELDEAARRRFVKRLYIPLPEIEARLQLVKKLISNEKHELSQEDFDRISVLSDGHSGADIKNLCSEASLGPIRSIDFNQIENIQVNDVRPVRMEDFEKAFNRVRSSVSPKDLEQYITWDKLYGSGF